MPNVEVIVGLPGSGKSTSIPEDFDGFIYSTDNVLEELTAKTGETYNQVFKDNINYATKLMDDLLANYILMRADVLWDQTNMSPKKRKSILSRFPKSYRKVCRCIAPPCTAEEWAELDRRLASREGKTIPHHIIEAMANSYVEPELDEGFDYILVVDLFGNILAEKGDK